jgi:LysM repeat protein
MRKLSAKLDGMAAAITLVATLLVTAPAAWAETYLVRPGDTLSAIARQTWAGPIYGDKGSLAKLLTANPDLSSESVIHPGQKLTLGARVFTEHRIQRGETLSSIAAEYTDDKPIYGKGGALEELMKANPELQAERLIPGQIVFVPMTPPSDGTTFAEATPKHEPKKRRLAASPIGSPVGTPLGTTLETTLGSPKMKAPTFRTPLVYAPGKEPKTSASERVPAKAPKKLKAQQPKAANSKVSPLDESSPQRVEAKAIARTAKEYFKNKQFDRALDSYRQARTLDEGLVTNWIGEIRSLVALNRRGEARSLASELVEKRPNMKSMRYLQQILGKSAQVSSN